MREFELKKEHIMLLSEMFVGWNTCEFGAPEINPKRPYGNSDVYRDMAEILKIEHKLCPHCSEPLSEIDSELFDKLHKETQTALQIVLRTKSFKTGIYIADDIRENWRRG